MNNSNSNRILDFISLIQNKNVLVCGIGGGGDILATIPTVNFLRKFGAKALIGAVVWERFVVDPVPGPISLEEMMNINKINNCIAFVNDRTYAIRDNKVIIPQLVRVSQYLKEKLIAIDISKGVKNLIKCLNDFSRKHNIELIIGIDSGGDVLAKGGEEELWSPIADQMMLSALANLEIDSILGIFGLGTDGELPLSYILERLREIAMMDGYLWLMGLTRKDISEIEKLLKNVVTETNLAAIEAVKGLSKEFRIRNGSRIIDLSLGVLTAITVFLDINIVYSQSNMAKSIVNTESIWEVWKRLNEMRIFTELDTEYGVLELFRNGKKPDLIKIREKWKKDPKIFIAKLSRESYHTS